MAFRMVKITQRPLPVGAKDIGIWTTIFNFILIMSVVTTTGAIAFMMYPFREMETRWQLIVFILFEHGLMFVLAMVYLGHPSVPIDVEIITRQNQEFLAAHESKHQHADREEFMKKSFEWNKYNLC